jgi:PAS domain S-box-containing protein
VGRNRAPDPAERAQDGQNKPGQVTVMGLPISRAASNALQWSHIGNALARLTICTVAVFGVTAALYALPFRDRTLTAALTFLFVVLIVSTFWGFRYAVFVSFLAALGFSFLAPPLGRIDISDSRDVLALAAFLVIGIIASYLSARARRAEEAAQRSEKELRDVIETIPAMAWSGLPDGSNVFANRRWTEYTGLSAEETAGSGWKSAVHPEDLERYVDKWCASLATGQPFESEVRMRRATDGAYRWFLNRGVPVRDEQGNVLKWYGILTDIEERKRAEQERERLRQIEADLAHMKRVTTMGELAASLANEMKQPIAAAVVNARACARWLRRDAPDFAEACEAASSMVRDATRAADIVDRVCDLYRRDTPERELVDINEMIREMTVLLHLKAHRHSIAIHTELAESLPKVMADRVELQQLLMNLMLNGIEAMKDAAGELVIKSQRTEDGQLLISVSDTGIGIPVEQADRIFDAFFTTKPHGTGMGLSISRTIVESHGGRLWVTSNRGRGATFQFTVPTR